MTYQEIMNDINENIPACYAWIEGNALKVRYRGKKNDLVFINMYSRVVTNSGSTDSIAATIRNKYNLL